MFDALSPMTMSLGALDPQAKARLALMMGANLLANANQQTGVGMGRAALSTMGGLDKMMETAMRTRLLNQQMEMEKKRLGLQEKRYGLDEKQYGLQEKRYGLAERGLKFQEDANRRAEDANRRAQEALGLNKEQVEIARRNAETLAALRSQQAAGLAQRAEGANQFGQVIREEGPPRREQLIAESMMLSGNAPTAARLLYPEKFSSMGGIFGDLLGSETGGAPSENAPQPAPKPQSIEEQANQIKQEQAAREAKLAVQHKTQQANLWFGKNVNRFQTEGVTPEDRKKLEELYPYLPDAYKRMAAFYYQK